MADRRIVAYNPDTLRLQVGQPGDRYWSENPIYIDNILVTTGQINGRDVSVDGIKQDLLTVTAATDLDSIRNKVTQITITQPVDLDVLESRVNELDASVVLKGTWDASTLLFPISVSAGESWICSVAGSAGGIPVAVNDRIIALVDNASPVIAADWYLVIYTDQVLSVAGRTGAIVLKEVDITDLQGYLLPTDIDSLAKLNVIVGDSLLLQGSIDSLAKLNGIVTETLIDSTDARLTDARTPTAHTHAVGDITNIPIVKSYTFISKKLTSGEAFNAGFYKYSATDANLTNAAATVTLGGANLAYGAFAFLVYGGGSTDGNTVTITVTGTSITPTGVRTISDSEILFTGPIVNLTINDYKQTIKKWIGQITYTLTSDGVNFTFDMNYGLAQYENNGEIDFTLNKINVHGVAQAAEAGLDIELLHHKAAGWTYAAVGFVAGNTPIASLATDYNTELVLADGEPFAWERTGLNTNIVASNEEGILLRITTTTSDSIRYMNNHIGFFTSFP